MEGKLTGYLALLGQSRSPAVLVVTVVLQQQ